jgi:hypothetical protein
MVKCGVLFEVRTGFLNNIYTSFKTGLYITCSQVIDRSNHRHRQLYPILNKSSSIDINPALTGYKTLIRPIITYAAPVW